MIVSETDPWSGAAGVRYRHFVERLIVIRNTLLASDMPIDTVMNGIADNSRKALDEYFRTEHDLIAPQLNHLAESALQSRDLMSYVTVSEQGVDALRALVEASGSYFLSSVFTQGLRDNAQIKIDAQLIILRAETTAKLQKVNIQTGRIMAMTGLNDPSYLDTMGRAVPLERHIRNISRTNMLSVQNEAVLLAMGLAGHRFARMRKTDKTGAVMDVARISLVTSGIAPKYAEVRQRILHPNSTTWIDLEPENVHA